MEWRQVEWAHSAGGQLEQVPVRYIPNDQDPRILLLAGLGETGEVLQDTVRYLGGLGLPVAGLELTYPGASPEIIKATLGQALPAVARDIQGRRGRGQASPLHLIGSSKGGSEVLMAAGIADETGGSEFGAIGVLNPAGLTRTFADIKKLGPRLKLFRQRLLLNADLEPETVALPEMAMHDITRLDFALKQDNGAEVVRKLLAKGHLVRLFSGEKDPVFPPDEMRRTLGSAGLEHVLQEVPGHHGSLSAASGKKQIAIVARWVMGQL